MGKQKILLTKGLPASGKTTFAKELINKEPDKWKRINKDDLRAMLDDSRWSKGNEQFVLDLRNHITYQALEKGYSVIIDDTNLHPKHEEYFRLFAKEKGVDFEVKDFTNIDVDECIRRDLKREKPVGAGTIRQMYRQFLMPKITPPLYLPDKPNAVMCDIDGTLALFGNKNPYDRNFLEDEVNFSIRNIVNTYSISGYKIIIVSGRKNKYLEDTKKWLKEKIVAFDEIFMPRADDDNRKDFIIKQEIYDNNIKGKYNIAFVLDDRNQVVRLWRELGFTCLQVNDGDF